MYGGNLNDVELYKGACIIIYDNYVCACMYMYVCMYVCMYACIPCTSHEAHSA